MAASFDTLLQLKSMAFRNLARHRVKTFLTVLAITISVALYIFMDAWLAGMNIESMRNIVNYETGAAKLQTKTYFDKKDDLPMYENFVNWEEYAAALDEAGYAAAPRFVFTGTLYSETGSAPMEFNAVDPDADTRILRYADYIESGRFIRPGEFAIVLGNVTAEKLKIGIPQRPTRRELEELLTTVPETERDFIKNLYEPANQIGGGAFASKKEPKTEVNERYSLKKNADQADIDRYWQILAETGRNNVRISTVIDIKAAPDSIRKDKFDVDLVPLLTSEELALFSAAYGYDDLTGAYYLVTDDAALLNQVLSAMARVDYSGAIRHVNQLVSAVAVGLINSPDPKNNNNTAWIPLDVLRDEAGLMLEGCVTELLIREKNAGNDAIPGKSGSPLTIAAALNKALAETGKSLPPELAVHGWQDYSQDYLAASAGDAVSTRVIAVILFILSFLGISNTMLLAILERAKETGMMRAQGMTDGELVVMYMIEAGMVGFFGAVFGIIAGCLINIPMVKYGVDFSAMTESMGGDIGYRINGAFRSAWNIPVIFCCGIAAVLLSALMALIPTRNALKMPVTESLRFE